MKYPIASIYTVIKQIPEGYSSETTCPFCGSKHVSNRGTMMTLVGGGSDVPGDEDNPNHYSEYNYCRDCQKRFSKEYKGRYQWYNDFENNHRIVRGVHMCFETANYNCVKCDGEVSRTYTELDGSPLKGGLCYSYKEGERRHQYREFWICKECDHGAEMELL